MNKIAVLTYKDETQQLKTLREIATIGREYKQEWRRLKALANYCFFLGIKSINIHTMDGKKVGWIIEETGRNF